MNEAALLQTLDSPHLSSDKSLENWRVSNQNKIIIIMNVSSYLLARIQMDEMQRPSGASFGDCLRFDGCHPVHP